MTVINAGMVAVVASEEIFDILPRFMRAIQVSDMSSTTANWVALGLIGGICAISVSRYRASRRRWVQASFNQRFLDIASASGIDPTM